MVFCVTIYFARYLQAIQKNWLSWSSNGEVSCTGKNYVVVGKGGSKPASNRNHGLAEAVFKVQMPRGQVYKHRKVEGV
jgi:hypothetical protein